MLAIDQQVLHQQFFQEGVQLRRQLGEENPQVGHDLVARQRASGRFGADAATVDYLQLAAVAEQVVQVQVFLGEAHQMQACDGAKGLAQHFLLAVGQRCIRFDLAPGIPEAFRRFQVLEQQPAAQPRLIALAQQRRGIDALPIQGARAGKLALEVPLGLAADQQLGQHLTPLPQGHADVALPGQHPQQALQLESASHVELNGKLRGTPRAGKFGQGHRAPSLLRRRLARRASQSLTCAESCGRCR
ncbi:hypothetical protein D9M69_383420 [compost metagenome]